MCLLSATHFFSLARRVRAIRAIARRGNNDELSGDKLVEQERSIATAARRPNELVSMRRAAPPTQPRGKRGSIYSPDGFAAISRPRAAATLRAIRKRNINRSSQRQPPAAEASARHAGLLRHRAFDRGERRRGTGGIGAAGLRKIGPAAA